MVTGPWAPSRDIDGIKRGNRLGFWFFRTSLRMFGLKGAYGLLYFVCIHYALFDRTAVRAGTAYLSKRFPGIGPLKKRFAVYRLLISQGKALIDRFFMMSGLGVFDIRFKGMDSLRKEIAGNEKGFILLMSHMGNWQVVMTALTELDRRVHLLMRPEDNPAVKEALDICGSREAVRIISPDGYLGGVLEMMKALESGDIVSIMGDRGYGENVLDVVFLGDRARFPYAAFSLAAAVECPVFVLLTEKVSTTQYDLTIGRTFHPGFMKGADKRTQLRDWVQAYAQVLEEYVDRHPFQCFLFRDIWSEGEE